MRVPTKCEGRIAADAAFRINQEVVSIGRKGKFVAAKLDVLVISENNERHIYLRSYCRLR